MLQEFNAGGTHEENPNNGIQIGIGLNGLPNKVEEGETKFNDYIFSDRLTPINTDIVKELGLPTSFKNLTFAEISKKVSKESKEKPNDAISKRYQEVMLNKLIEAQEYTKKMTERQQKMLAMNSTIKSLMEKGFSREEATNTVISEIERQEKEEAYQQEMAARGYDPQGQPMVQNQDIPMQNQEQPFIEEEIPMPQEGDNSFDLGGFTSTLLRFAPTIGSAVDYVKDVARVNNRFDPSLPNEINRIANSYTSYSPSSYVGKEMTYSPLDPTYSSNMVAANSASSARDFQNNSGGNPNAILSGLAYNSYNRGLQLGNVYRQAQEINDQRRMQIAQHNNQLAQFREQLRMQAHTNNMNALESSNRYRLAALNNRVTQEYELAKARTNNRDNLLKNLSALGETLMNKDSRDMVYGLGKYSG